MPHILKERKAILTGRVQTLVVGRKKGAKKELK
jgi:hypothetical protein